MTASLRFSYDETLRRCRASDTLPLHCRALTTMDQTIAAGMAGTAVSQAVPSTDDPRVVTARRVFRGALAFNTALTLFWLVSMATDSRFFFADYRITLQSVGTRPDRHRLLLPDSGASSGGASSRWRCAGSASRKDERRDAFSSRMDRPYDVGGADRQVLGAADPHRGHGRPPRAASRSWRSPGSTASTRRFWPTRSRTSPSRFADDQPVRGRAGQLDLPRRLLPERVHRRDLLRPAVAGHGRLPRTRQLPADHHALDRVQVHHGADEPGSSRASIRASSSPSSSA